MDKIVIFSDLHGRVKAMEKLAKRLKEEKPDLLIGLGDYLYNGPRNGVPDDYEPMTVATMLNFLPYKKVFVKGNCDSRVDQAVLSTPIEDNKIVDLFGIKVGLYHGDVPSMDGLDLSQVKLYMFGHSHVYLLEKCDFASFLNPGSVAFPKGGSEGTYATMDKDRACIKGLEDGKVLLEKKLADLI